MNKTFSITDKRVLQKLEQVKANGIKPSHYITALILADINNDKLSKDDFIRLMMNILSSTNVNNQQNMNINTDNSSGEVMDKIKSIIDLD